MQLALNNGYKDSSAVILAGPSIISLPLSSLIQVSTCGWLLSLLRAPASSAITCGTGAGAAKGGTNSGSCTAHNHASSCLQLENNGLNHNLGDLLYIVKESSIVEVVDQLGLPSFASRVRATHQLREMYNRFSQHLHAQHFEGSEILDQK